MTQIKTISKSLNNVCGIYLEKVSYLLFVIYVDISSPSPTISPSSFITGLHGKNLSTLFSISLLLRAISELQMRNKL